MRRVGMMHPVAGVVGVVVIAVILWGTFETVVLPRRVARRLRPARLLFRTLWRFLLLAAAGGSPPGGGGGCLCFFLWVCSVGGVGGGGRCVVVRVWLCARGPGGWRALAGC